ncbi:MAG: hypothetical protein K0B52_01595 [FCB group bacterium]|nr:hypothetical protein [FCB group bacterium]
MHLNTVKIQKIIISIFLLVAGFTHAENKPIELLHAATMQKVTVKNEDGTTSPENSYIMFDKDVHIKQGEVHLYADRAYQFPDLDLLRLKGNVMIDDDSVQIWFDEGEYNTQKKDIRVETPIRIHYDTRYFSALSLSGNLDKDIYRAYGDVEVMDSSSYAYADSLLFDRHAERAFLYGNAMMADTVNHMVMRGSEIAYFLDIDRFYGYKDASVYETLKDGTKRFEVFAKYLEGDIKDGWLIAVDSVFVLQDSSSARCDSLFYIDSLQTVQFYGNAHVQYKDIDMYAPDMTLQFERNRLGELRAGGNPRVTLKEQGYLREKEGESVIKTSEMTGKSLRLIFDEKDNPERMDMAGMVISDYHVFKDSVYKGINHMQSDTIRLLFEEGDVRHIYAVFEVDGKFMPDSTYQEMDTTAFYEGMYAHYDLGRDLMFVYPDATMRYGNISLQADTMKIDWNTNILYAYSAPGGALPEFVQGDDPPVRGNLFEYNLDTKRGKITRGRTHIKEGYYHGRSVLKTEDEPLYVTHGIFTTCDLDEPHFCIEARRMKVIPGDRVFAQDIVFKIADIPLMYIPSFFVPIEEGDRRSGWILPSFGRYNTKGWALAGMGYYWAANDYYDARMLFDFYDNYGINVELRQRYAWRYHISGGNLTLRYWNNFLSSSPNQGFRVSINHPQTIGMKSSLNISGTFTNDTQQFTRELDKDERLEQQLLSSASFRTSLGPFSVNINASRKEDLLTGSTTTNFPRFSISKPTASVFKKKKMTDPDKWYHKFTYDIRSEMDNSMTHTWIPADSLYRDDVKNKLQTNMSVRYNNKLFGFLTVSPELRYYEDWTTIYKEPQTRNDSVLVDSSGKILWQDGDGLKRRSRFDLSTTASTKLYGVFNVNILGLKALRHTLGMSLNYTYRPDQSGNPEYVFRGVDINGKEVEYDYFQGTLLGATPSSESQTFNFNFNHDLESKIVRRNGTERKTHLVNIKHSYNFLADSLRSSEIVATSTIRDLPGGMSLKIDAYFDPYAYRINEAGTGIVRIDQLAVPRMTYFRLGTELNLKSKTSTAVSAAREDDREENGEDDAEDRSVKTVAGSDPGFSNWSVRAGISFTSTASNPLNVTNRLLINTTVTANLTPKWSGTYRINFDVLEQKITDQYISLQRDLHCWALSLDWNPGDSFFISVYAKANVLKALKLEKRTGRLY